MINEQAELEAFERDGYVVIRGVYSPEEVQSLNREYEKVWMARIAEAKIQHNPEEPLNSLFPRLKDCHWDSETIRRLAFLPAAAGRLERWTGEEMLLVSTNYYFKPPGMDGIPCHQDNYGLGVNPGTCYAIWISLDEADGETGGMRFFPATHKLDIMTPEKIVDEKADTFGGYVQVLHAPDGYEAVQVTTEPGDIVIYHGHIMHDSPGNATADRFRRSLIAHFAGTGTERLLLNFNQLMDREGNRVRRRLNARSRTS
ncbi:phytanoyl-CoA dioxygenase [Paenibacillus sambharensis]|uniref:Phytanoyl-CoA dioxygenase n=2 Tax=Paenibacillus sambharensis TaxID=1803190 RepID=A0A2W1LPM8_9BACL|nr:phytanoyl-CoA dioxygenase [Paenibacillus sambharensis]